MRKPRTATNVFLALLTLSILLAGIGLAQVGSALRENAAVLREALRRFSVEAP